MKYIDSTSVEDILQELLDFTSRSWVLKINVPQDIVTNKKLKCEGNTLTLNGAYMCYKELDKFEKIKKLLFGNDLLGMKLPLWEMNLMKEAIKFIETNTIVDFTIYLYRGAISEVSKTTSLYNDQPEISVIVKNNAQRLNNIDNVHVFFYLYNGNEIHSFTGSEAMITTGGTPIALNGKTKEDLLMILKKKKKSELINIIQKYGI